MSSEIELYQEATPGQAPAGTNRLYVTTAKRLASVDDSNTAVVYVGADTSDVLTNKSLSDATCKFVDDGDATKFAQFSLAALGSGFGYTLTAAALAASRTLNLPLIRQTETLAVQPQIAGALVAAPTGIANTGGLMLGLAAASASNIITPQVTGRICVTISGVVAQSTTADGAKWHIRTGTGSAPANGAALVGTQSGGEQSMTFLTGVLKVPFSITTYVTGLTLGTAAWIDLVLATVTAGTATMTQVMVTAFEF